jgi:hypothetical protein
MMMMMMVVVVVMPIPPLQKENGKFRTKNQIH